VRYEDRRVWIAKDGSEHRTEQDAVRHEQAQELAFYLDRRVDWPGDKTMMDIALAILANYDIKPIEE